MSINTKLIEFNYCSALAIPYGELQDVIEWCQKNCVYNWYYKVLNEVGSSPGFYEFLFHNETDYINFLLWKK